jgi:hypothetical protein
MLLYIQILKNVEKKLFKDKEFLMMQHLVTDMFIF